MKRNTQLLSAIALAAALAACSSEKPSSTQQSSEPTPTPQAQPADAPEYKVIFKSVCAANQEYADCRGAYGFTVFADGKFEVGPSQENKYYRGKLNVEEKNSLDTALAKVVAELSVESATTAQVAEIEDKQAHDTIVFERREGSKELIKVEGAKMQFITASAEEAQKIHALMTELTLRYYPIPFPNPCIDGAMEVEAAHANLRSCNVDADCALVNNVYEPITAGGMNVVFTDLGEWIPALPVANAQLVGEQTLALQALRQEARLACGEGLYRPNSQQVYYQTSEVLPVCEVGVCKLRY